MHLPLYFLLHVLLLMPVFLLGMFFPFVFVNENLVCLSKPDSNITSSIFFQIAVFKLDCFLLSGILLHFHAFASLWLYID